MATVISLYFCLIHLLIGATAQIFTTPPPQIPHEWDKLTITDHYPLETSNACNNFYHGNKSYFCDPNKMLDSDEGQTAVRKLQQGSKCEINSGTPCSVYGLAVIAKTKVTSDVKPSEVMEIYAKNVKQRWGNLNSGDSGVLLFVSCNDNMSFVDVGSDFAPAKCRSVLNKTVRVENVEKNCFKDLILANVDFWTVANGSHACYTEDGDKHSTDSGIVIGVIIAAILVVCAITGGYCWYKKKSDVTSHKGDERRAEQAVLTNQGKAVDQAASSNA